VKTRALRRAPTLRGGDKRLAISDRIRAKPTFEQIKCRFGIAWKRLVERGAASVQVLPGDVAPAQIIRPREALDEFALREKKRHVAGIFALSLTIKVEHLLVAVRLLANDEFDGLVRRANFVGRQVSCVGRNGITCQ
jgi:hypothetical protein